MLIGSQYEKIDKYFKKLTDFTDIIKAFIMRLSLDKGGERMSEEMTKEEIQRFIDLCIRDGKDELETFRDLRMVLGVKYEPLNEAKDKE